MIEMIGRLLKFVIMSRNIFVSYSYVIMTIDIAVVVETTMFLDGITVMLN